jgi:hypothetical protein
MGPAARQLQNMAKNLIPTLLALAILFVTAGTVCAKPEMSLNMDQVIGQAIFASPELAAQVLTDALDTEDRETLKKIFGAASADLVPTDSIDREDIDKYVALYAQRHTLIPEGEQHFTLAIGEDNWTFPVPIIKGDSGWYFDTEAGIEQVRIRQIGRNELATMQAVLAYYDAQIEYAAQDRNGDGVLEYAQKFISKVGQRDGLYWETNPGEPQSPLGPLFANEVPEDDYHGYKFRILKSQGPSAQGGTYDYLIGGRLTGGFALVAWPVEYGETGVMSFMINHDGTVYEGDLGPDGASTATTMQRFDPGPGWVPSQDAQAGAN